MLSTAPCTTMASPRRRHPQHHAAPLVSAHCMRERERERETHTHTQRADAAGAVYISAYAPSLQQRRLGTSCRALSSALAAGAVRRPPAAGLADALPPSVSASWRASVLAHQPPFPPLVLISFSFSVSSPRPPLVHPRLRLSVLDAGRNLVSSVSLPVSAPRQTILTPGPWPQPCVSSQPSPSW